MLVGVVFIAAALFLTLIWRWYKLWNYWNERGVQSYGYPPPIGVLLPACTGRMTFAQLSQEIFHENPKSKMIGSWVLTKPVLFVKDHQYVHQILSEDFTTWPDRGFRDDPSLDPLSQHLINIGGDKWKTVRSWLASGFGLMAIRSRHDLLLDEAERLTSSIASEKDTNVDLDKVSKKTVLTVLSQITLGTSSSSSDVEELVNDAFSSSLWTSVRSFFRIACPFLLSYVGCKRFHSEHEASFIKLVDQRFKEEHSHHYQDMLQTLINSYKQYLLSESNNKDLRYELVGSNAFAMLAAGYDTTASSLSWMFFELAKNPAIQDRLHNEIQTVFGSHESLTQAALKQMHFLDNIVSEILRLYPSVCMTSRVCRRRTTLDRVELEPGTRVLVPIYAMHRDSTYFPSPDSFDPDRFSRPDFNKAAYLPFGKGPRICLGWRLAELMLKIYAVSFVKNFNLRLSPEMKLPVGFSTRSLFLGPRHPILLRLTPRS